MRYRFFDHEGRYIVDHVDKGSIAPLSTGEEIPLENETVTVEVIHQPQWDVANNLLFVPVTVRRGSDPERPKRGGELLFEILKEGHEFVPDWQRRSEKSD